MHIIISFWRYIQIMIMVKKSFMHPTTSIFNTPMMTAMLEISGIM